MSQSPTVLIVEDERKLRELYTQWLEGEYQVLSAASGEQALATLTEDVRVVLLDRRLPGRSGGETLEEIRERADQVWIGMLTAVEPEPEIVDFAIDEYLVKPVSRATLRDTVDSLCRRSTYERAVDDYLTAVAKRQALERAHSQADLDSSPKYRELVAEIERARTRADEELTRFDVDDFHAAFQRIDAPSAQVANR